MPRPSEAQPVPSPTQIKSGEIHTTLPTTIANQQVDPQVVAQPDCGECNETSLPTVENEAIARPEIQDTGCATLDRGTGLCDVGFGWSAPTLRLSWCSRYSSPPHCQAAKCEQAERDAIDEAADAGLVRWHIESAATHRGAFHAHGCCASELNPPRTVS